MEERDDEAEISRFKQVVAPGAVRLDEAVLRVARHCKTDVVDVDVDAGLAALDDLAQQLSEPTLDAVVRLLFRDLGFVGARDSYYDPANSYLDDVIVSRTGIPITLSILAIEVARRAGVPLFGVGMPGHFLVGDRGDDDVFLDAFNGTLLDSAGAQRLFESMQPRAAFERDYLAETPASDIVLRVLNNLRMIHHQTRNTAEIVKVLELMVCLPDCPLDEYRNLAGALDLLGRVDDAARHLEAAAERYGGSDAAQLEAQATRLWAKLN